MTTIINSTRVRLKDVFLSRVVAEVKHSDLVQDFLRVIQVPRKDEDIISVLLVKEPVAFLLFEDKNICMALEGANLVLNLQDHHPHLSVPEWAVHPRRDKNTWSLVADQVICLVEEAIL